MGSWSEACGFSGLEIGEGDVAYVCLIKAGRGDLNDGAMQYYAPTTTFIRGVYNDYGYLRIDDDQAMIDVFNAQTGMTLALGEDFSGDHMEGRDDDRWWLHGKVFDLLPTMEQDFPYAYDRKTGECVKVDNIGGGVDFWINTIREALAEVKSITDPMLQAISEMRMSDVFGYRPRGYINKKALMGAENIEPYLTGIKRVSMVSIGLSEVRRRFFPSEGAGPQHGNSTALTQLGQLLVDARKDYEDDE